MAVQLLISFQIDTGVDVLADCDGVGALSGDVGVTVVSSCRPRVLVIMWKCAHDMVTSCGVSWLLIMVVVPCGGTLVVTSSGSVIV